VEREVVGIRGPIRFDAVRRVAGEQMLQFGLRHAHLLRSPLCSLHGPENKSIPVLGDFFSELLPRLPYRVDHVDLPDHNRIRRRACASARTFAPGAGSVEDHLDTMDGAFVTYSVTTAGCLAGWRRRRQWDAGRMCVARSSTGPCLGC
jgi:hypothetical protein